MQYEEFKEELLKFIRIIYSMDVFWCPYLEFSPINSIFIEKYKYILQIRLYRKDLLILNILFENEPFDPTKLEQLCEYIFKHCSSDELDKIISILSRLIVKQI